MNKLPSSVIMLPTDGVGVIWKFDAADSLIVAQGTMESNIPFKNLHLYFISSGEIKKNSWYFNRRRNEVLQCIDDVNGKASMKLGDKLCFATTDQSIDLPFIEDSFVDEYVKCEGKIKEVAIELEETEDYVGGSGHTAYPTFSKKLKLIGGYVNIIEVKKDLKTK